ncbi:MAG: biopolymer transporter ExbD [Chitinophagaceae bacterium]|nr:biopolymer transporter ExbD [Chitinophagaceae bacterium]
MPSVKIPRKSTDTDMTPFVDIAFLILSFFIMATKFKPPEPVEIKTPGSVISQKMPESNAVLISIDSSNKVYFTLKSEKEPEKFDELIKGINEKQNLGLTPAEINNFKKTIMVGVPFSQLKGLLDLDPKEQEKIKQPGIPVLDSTNNQLVWWIQQCKVAFAGEQLVYLIKGDGASKYPAFEAVVEALKKNDELKYGLVTDLDDVPKGSALDIAQQQGLK